MKGDLGRSWSWAAALFWGALLPGAAWAAGGGHHEDVNWTELGFAFFNFAVFVGGLVFLLRKPLREFLSHRRATLEENIQEGARLRTEAEAELNELKARLSNLDRERDEIFARYREEGELERARILKRAQETAEAMRREIRHRLEQEARSLRRELLKTAVDSALRNAEEILRAELTAQDRVRLADDYIEKLKTLSRPTVHS